MTTQARRPAAKLGAATDALVPRMRQICGPDGVITVNKIMNNPHFR